MTTEPFAFLRGLLARYAEHFDVEDVGETFTLNEERPAARTLFGWTRRGRTGARFVFYPLHVFPDLVLPAVLARQVRGKCEFTFKTLSAPERDALETVVAAGYERVVAQQSLAPGHSYARKLDLAQVASLIGKIVASSSSGATMSIRKSDIVVILPAKRRVGAALAAREKTPGTLVFKTITPAEHEALAALLR